jgi:DNA-binding transcriptional regulator GbsR (MarR family)
MTPDDTTRPADAPLALPRAHAVRRFVEHWGLMARLWGINATMAELFALLYVTGCDWSADALREQLRISRGNVSMNLRELMAWGVVQKVHRPGERREYYRVDGDVWTLFRRIIQERKRREVEPTLHVLESTSAQLRDDPDLHPLHPRVEDLRRLFTTVDDLATHLLDLSPDDLRHVLDFLQPEPTPHPRHKDP